MAEAMILEFDGVGRSEYEAVNDALGIDLSGLGADWPDGLLFHAGAGKPGGWVVFEVWESREAQGRFMGGQLAAALQAGGITAAPTRVEWLELARYNTRSA